MKPIATTQLVNSILLFLMTSFIPFEGIGQQITFEKSYDYGLAEAAYCVQQTHDGGYILAGRQGVSISTRRLMLIKTDSLGEVEWEKFYGKPGHEYVANSIQQTADSGYIVTGYKTVAGMGANVFLMKTDVNGDTLWSKDYGTGRTEEGYSLKQLYDGGFVIAGQWADSLAVLIRTDSKGDTLWVKKYKPEQSDQAIAFSMDLTSDTGFVICGAAIMAGKAADVYVVRTNAEGSVLWTNTIGGIHTESGEAIQETGKGSFIVTGYTWSYGAGNYDVYLIKMDANGDTLWTRTYGDEVQNAANSVQQTEDGGYIIGGFTHQKSAAWVIKTDSAGKVKWNRLFKDKTAEFVLQTSDRGYAFCGFTRNASAYLIKTDSAGNIPTGITSHTRNSEIEIKLYPNPMLNKAQLEVMGVNNHPITISIFDQQGRQVKQLKARKSRIVIERGGLPSGLYLFRVVNKKGIIGTGKIIIQ